MPAKNFQDAERDHGSSRSHRPRKSYFEISDPIMDSSPIDCILVYNLPDHQPHGQNRKTNSAQIYPDTEQFDHEQQRIKFEEYLREKEGLVVTRFHTNSSNHAYVKIHAPFQVLLSTAETFRMKLPIEKIREALHDKPEKSNSCWYRFTNWFKKPFRLEKSLTKYELDYYTAMYSSSNPKFDALFDTLHGSREEYFTSAERSLLTIQLLARAHDGEFNRGYVFYDDDDDDDDENVNVHDGIHSPGIKMPGLKTVVALSQGTGRPGIDRMKTKNIYEDYFPLHQPLRDDLTKIPDDELNDREKLQKHWATMRKCFKFQPLGLIRSYMGEKVAFYFAFSGFYNQMLIPASVVGLIVFIYGIASMPLDDASSEICGSYGNSTYMCPTCDKSCPFWKLSDSCLYSRMSYVFDNVATIAFAVLMSFWARWFVELWKRREAFLQYEWDSIDFERNFEPIRPEYERGAKKIGGKQVNPVTGVKEPHIPIGKRVPYFILAIIVVLLAVGFICATLFATIVYRVQMDYILQQTSVKTYSSIIITITSAIMNLISSLLSSLLYYWLAKKITFWELHKYQTTHDDSLAIKIYLFQFFNFYASIFYIAFFKGRFYVYPSQYGEPSAGNFKEQCDAAGCFVELSIQFIIIMTGKQIANNVVEYLWSILCAGACCSCCSSDESEKKYQCEIDKDLLDLDATALIDEYLELIIQFGFVTLFVVAFPLAPLFALINNLIEVRLDAWKILNKYKRPIPYKASDIGIWDDVFSAISYLAVLTNGLILAWTSDFVPQVTYRVLHSTGTSLSGFVSWTLSAFPIADYNSTGMMTSNVPSGLTYCYYREFRESTGPSYSHTSVYWNVLAARLAFILVFEHVVFFIVYLLQWLVSDVPEDVQNKIDRERYIDQTERWGNHTNRGNYQGSVAATQAAAKLANRANDNPQYPPRAAGNPSKARERSPKPRERSPKPRERSPIRVHIRSPVEQPQRRVSNQVKRLPNDDDW